MFSTPVVCERKQCTDFALSRSKLFPSSPPPYTPPDHTAISAAQGSQWGKAFLNMPFQVSLIRHTPSNMSEQFETSASV